jgi:Carboxypeptidase regulatory-like domain
VSSVFAQTTPKMPPQATATQPGPRMLTGTRASIFATVQGNALDASSAPLSAATVRLRDARFGKVSSNQVTDKAGLFGFGSVEPGNYVVELIDRTNVVLATSELLTVEPGDTASAVVKLPSRIQTFGGLFSHGVQQALAVTAAAAAAGVLAQSVTGVDASAR